MDPGLQAIAESVGLLHLLIVPLLCLSGLGAVLLPFNVAELALPLDLQELFNLLHALVLKLALEGVEMLVEEELLGTKRLTRSGLVLEAVDLGLEL